MKIVFFIGTFNFGGAEKHALLLADYYKNHLYWDVEVWGWSELEGPIPSLCKAISVKTSIVKKWNYDNLIKRKYLELYYKNKFKGVDVVMSFNNLPNIFCAQFIQYTDVKLHVWAQQGIDGYLFPKKQYRDAIRNLKCVISNSQNGIDFLVNEISFNPDIIHLVHNGIKTELLPRDSIKWDEKLNLSSENRFNAVMVANITRLKDHPTLIRAWEIVTFSLKGKGIDAQLFLAGRKDNMYEESYNLVKDLNLENNVSFLGVISDVNNLVEPMDLAILSSPSEGLPNAVLEVMLLEKPFVGTDILGIREAVGESNYQFLAKEKDVNKLSELILKFAEDSELRKNVGLRNRLWVENNFPIEKLWIETHKIVMNQLS